MGAPSVEPPGETLTHAVGQWEIPKSGMKCCLCDSSHELQDGFKTTVGLHHLAGLATERDRHAGAKRWFEHGPPLGISGQVGLFEELNEEINGLDDTEVEVDVATDSGACAHVFGPDDPQAT